jgi:hypothetical protein
LLGKCFQNWAFKTGLSKLSFHDCAFIVSVSARYPLVTTGRQLLATEPP